MTPERCPSCGAKLRPDMLACPNCPMSFPEDDDRSEPHPLKQTRYYQFGLPLLFFAAIGWSVWQMGSGLFRLAEQGVKSENLDILGDRHPAPGASAKEPSSYPARAKADEEGPSSFIAISAPDGGRPPRPAREWKLRGRVFDLVTLKPVAGCLVSFLDEGTNRRIRTRTGEDGRYRTIVPSLPGRGYAVVLAKNGYAPSYLDPGAQGVQEMSLATRRELSRVLAVTLSAAPATVQALDEAPLLTDFYLAPHQ